MNHSDVNLNLIRMRTNFFYFIIPTKYHTGFTSGMAFNNNGLIPIISLTFPETHPMTKNSDTVFYGILKKHFFFLNDTRFLMIILKQCMYYNIISNTNDSKNMHESFTVHTCLRKKIGFRLSLTTAI